MSVILLSPTVRPSSWHKVHCIRFTARQIGGLIDWGKKMLAPIGRTQWRTSSPTHFAQVPTVPHLCVGNLVGIIENATSGLSSNDTLADPYQTPHGSYLVSQAAVAKSTRWSRDARYTSCLLGDAITKIRGICKQFQYIVEMTTLRTLYGNIPALWNNEISRARSLHVYS